MARGRSGARSRTTDVAKPDDEQSLEEIDEETADRLIEAARKEAPEETKMGVRHQDRELKRKS